MAGKLSYRQHKVLCAMDKLGAHGEGEVTARDIAGESGQSSDGAAYTLRSLVRRGLVAHGGHDGDRWGYRLTESGLAVARRGAVVKDDYDLDVAELGERAADWLTHEQIGRLYTELKDRTWSVVLQSYAKVTAACRVAAGTPVGEYVQVPAEWTPQLDEHGMWHMPPDKASEDGR